MINDIVKRIPIVRDIARLGLRLSVRFRRKGFSSEEYWDRRYRTGGNSGPGSYNRLAQYKAEVLNRFVAERQVQSVIEFGSGDGAQLRSARYPRYTGVDVSRAVLEKTARDFADDPTKRFIHSDECAATDMAELSLSLDVIYHLIEDSVFERYMTQLFDAAQRFVIIYSSNNDRQSDAVHVRHRKFTDWVEHERPNFMLTDHQRNPFPEQVRDIKNTSFADFYFFERLAAPA